MLEGIGASSGSQSFGFSEAAGGSALEQRDQFLKLLTFQLKSQNPLKPYDNQEFAAQLAQFSQLEQLSDIRTLMEEQSRDNVLLSQTMSNAALPGLLGKTAKAFTNHLQLESGKDQELGVKLDFPAESGRISILDSNGNEVKTIDLRNSELKAGDNSIIWDGKDNEGNDLPSGSYTFFADMTDSNGATYQAETYTSGKIEAVRFKSDGTVLILNGMEISLGDIKDVGI